jgi:hypothetical protein
MAITPFNPDRNITSIVFIDGSLVDLQAILLSVDPSATAIVFNPKQDGLQQIAEALTGISSLDAIHIISHGSSGQINLGTAKLGQNTFAQYRSQLATIGKALTEKGDILLYGCNVGQGDTGLSFIDQLAVMTGANVAASDDLTGNANLGGDWVLEANTGSIEAVSLSSFGYSGLLGDDYTANIATTGLFSAATTGLFSVNGSATGKIESVGDADWFRISLTAGQQVHFDLDSATRYVIWGASEGLWNPYLQGIYDSAGTLIANTSGSVGSTSAVNFTAPATGDYFVSAAGDSGATGTYNLTVHPGLPYFIKAIDSGSHWGDYYDQLQFLALPI